MVVKVVNRELISPNRTCSVHTVRSYLNGQVVVHVPISDSERSGRRRLVTIRSSSSSSRARSRRGAPPAICPTAAACWLGPSGPSRKLTDLHNYGLWRANSMRRGPGRRGRPCGPEGCLLAPISEKDVFSLPSSCRRPAAAGLPPQVC